MRAKKQVLNCAIEYHGDFNKDVNEPVHLSCDVTSGVHSTIEMNGKMVVMFFHYVTFCFNNLILEEALLNH